MIHPELKLIEKHWYSVHKDYIPLFGTDSIPTPFNHNMTKEQVQAEIDKRNAER